MSTRKTKLVWLLSVLPTFISFSSHATATTSDFECFSDQPENEVCVVVPPGSPTSLTTASQAKDAIKPLPLMVSSREVSGGAASQPYFLGDADSAEYTIDHRQEALSASYRSLENLRWIETFLKTGPSALSDDIRVQPASRRISTKP